MKTPIPHGLVGERICPRCATLKPFREFGTNRGASSGMQSWCLVCHRDRAREWRQNNPEASRAVVRKCRYGIGEAEVARMLKAQDGICPACAWPLGAKYAVDHCHKTNKVRALLHINCNTALGLMREDYVAIQQLASYARFAEGVACDATDAPLMRVLP